MHSYPKKMVKSGYYGNEDLDLVWDSIKVHQMNPFITTDSYCNDFQKNFLARNIVDCNQIRSNQIAASVNALNHFHF